jgi:hypothetical protein
MGDYPTETRDFHRAIYAAPGNAAPMGWPS